MQINNLEKSLKDEFDKSLRELPNVYSDNVNVNLNKIENEANNKMLQSKNEYLININDNEYENKDPKVVLEDVFRK